MMKERECESLINGMDESEPRTHSVRSLSSDGCHGDAHFSCTDSGRKSFFSLFHLLLSNGTPFWCAVSCACLPFAIQRQNLNKKFGV
jgi:hypothetical protein